MPIDALSEPLLTLADVRERLPRRNGRRVALSLIYRWSAVGCIARDGNRVRLETIKVGGRVHTSESAINEFFAALSRRAEDVRTSLTAPASTNEVAAAERACEAAGI